MTTQGWLDHIVEARPDRVNRSFCTGCNGHKSLHFTVSYGVEDPTIIQVTCPTYDDAAMVVIKQVRHLVRTEGIQTYFKQTTDIIRRQVLVFQWPD